MKAGKESPKYAENIELFSKYGTMKYVVLIAFSIVIASTFVYFVSNEIVLSQSEDRVRDAMLEIRAFHRYIQNDMHPNYYRLMEEKRLPDGFYAPELLSSSYIARSFQKYYNNERSEIGLPEIKYKLAAIDPRNTINKATPEEERLIARFNEDEKLDHIRYAVEEDGTRYLVVVMPFLRNQPACLVCHGRPEDAPVQLQNIYHWTGGYDRKIGDISGVEIMKTPIQAKANVPLLATVGAILFTLILSISFVLNILYKKVIRQKIDDLILKQELLIEEKNKADAANKAKSIFLANMSHEIRTPLNGIFGMLQLLNMTDMTREQEDYVSSAKKATGRLTGLLSDLLDISRIESGRLEIVASEFDLSATEDAVRELFELTVQEKGLRLVFTRANDVPVRLIGDETRLRQILFNLVGNAIKFTDQGEVNVAFSAPPQCQGARFRLLITVSDTGIGIAEEDLKTIFEPFVQAEASYTRRFQGAGLGLTIVRRLAALMDGEMSLDSVHGVGTTVCLSLPFTLPAGDEGASPGEEQETVGRIQPPVRILLAEDDIISAMAYRRMLEKMGCSVAVARNGREALDRLGQDVFDLVVMDVQMPVMDGVEATKAIRESASLGEQARLPIIAMTAYAMAGEKEIFLAAGMTGYLAKPVDREGLRLAIEAAMGRTLTEA